MRILLVDNYDSFTYNLVHYLEGCDCEVTVVRNDAVNLNDIHSYDKLVLSPGPGLPKESNQLMEVLAHSFESIPILGVCLGFQAIIEHLGGSLYNQSEVKHGVAEKCTVDPNSRLFSDLPKNFEVGLYHSWAATENVIPHELIITARSASNVVMAVEHRTLPVCGVQFHPESILTDNGKKIVENFVSNFK